MQPRGSSRQYQLGVRAVILRGDQEVPQNALYAGGTEVPIFMDEETFEVFCPTCGDDTLVGGQTIGSNGEQSMTCPNPACGMVWRRADDLPIGIGLAE